MLKFNKGTTHGASIIIEIHAKLHRIFKMVPFCECYSSHKNFVIELTKTDHFSVIGVTTITAIIKNHLFRIAFTRKHHLKTPTITAVFRGSPSDT